PYADKTRLSSYTDNVSLPIHSIRDLAAATRGRRLELDLSQAALAERVGVSRQWINEFESGKPRAELRLVLRLIEAIGRTMTLDGGQTLAADKDAGSAVDLDDLLDDYGRR